MKLYFDTNIYSFIAEKQGGEVVRKFLDDTPLAVEASSTNLPEAPFVNFFGRRLHYQSIPVVPVLHVKQWPLRPLMTRYVEPMTLAAQEIRQAMSRSMP